MKNQEFKAIVFEPMKEGKEVLMTTADFSPIVGGNYEIVANKHYIPNVPNTEIVVNEEGVLLGLPRNRGYHGTFIIVKTLGHEEYDSFTAYEVRMIKKILDNKKNFESLNTFLATFFEEKDIPVELFEYEKKGCYITLSNYDIIEAMLSSKDMHFLQQVEDIIRRIDLNNGDINHFLYHMGHSMANEIIKSNQSFFEI
jgi:hypothetical protein